MVISRVKDNCVRLAVLDEACRWHYHPTSDELFVVAMPLTTADRVLDVTRNAESEKEIAMRRVRTPAIRAAYSGVPTYV
jgi:hypothetical protein